ncbi:hypothetical protein [Erythrobacter sp. WG]|uniref:hypothetical protein n=1 Tax=Erythrobacter sp. WG TaxID=2985510 RepID=UPI00227138BE|nr:hypothetical protein [Erythrobacter sp. WG]MCX9148718.1 hypothetical protein [Erythrobacter sp. WG]
MSDHLSTFGGGTTPSGEQAWADRAAIVPAAQGAQLSEGVAIRRGTFAEMIRHIAQLPEGEREGYVIQKAGDRIYTAAEAMALASEPGFPAKDGG